MLAIHGSYAQTGGEIVFDVSGHEAAGSPRASSTSILGALATSRRFRRRRSTAPPRIRAVSVASGRRSREALHALIALMRPIPA